MSAAAASPQPAAFDLRNTSTYPIRLGRSLQQTTQSTRLGVQYNHKPSISDPEDTTTSIVPSHIRSRTQLSLKDGDDEYTYESTEHNGEHTYVLLPNETGDGYTLERLDASYKFNLSGAPGEEDARQLAKKYPHLQSESGDDADFDEDDAEDTHADAANPFDFRHYVQPTDSPSPPARPTKGSTLNTPSASQPPSSTNTPLARSVRKPPSAFAAQVSKPKPKPKPNPADALPQHKRARLSPEPDEAKDHHHHTERRANVPSVRIDRRASTRIALPPKQQPKKPQPAPQPQHSPSDDLSLDRPQGDGNGDDDDDDDDGDLILEGDVPAPRRTHYSQQRSLGAALSGGLGADRQGPRSLRSAASSPASQRVESPGGGSRRPSPLGRNVGSEGEGEDAEMDAEDEDGGYRFQRLHESDADAESDVDVDVDVDMDGDGDVAVEDEDDDDDGDVEEMALPSPAAHAPAHRASMTGTVVSGTGDDDFDLEQQMLLELEGGDDEGDEQQRIESDEESEEE